MNEKKRIGYLNTTPINLGDTPKILVTGDINELKDNELLVKNTNGKLEIENNLKQTLTASNRKEWDPDKDSEMLDKINKAFNDGDISLEIKMDAYPMGNVAPENLIFSYPVQISFKEKESSSTGLLPVGDFIFKTLSRINSYTPPTYPHDYCTIVISLKSSNGLTIESYKILGSQIDGINFFDFTDNTFSIFNKDIVSTVADLLFEVNFRLDAIPGILFRGLWLFYIRFIYKD